MGDISGRSNRSCFRTQQNGPVPIGNGAVFTPALFKSGSIASFAYLRMVTGLLVDGDDGFSLLDAREHRFRKAEEVV